MRIYHFYLPVLEWVRQQIAEVVQAHVEAGDPDRAPVIGLSCPQGGGKTTLVHVLRSVLLHEGTMSVALSIDDFYLPHEDLQKVCPSRGGPAPKPAVTARPLCGARLIRRARAVPLLFPQLRA